MPITVSVIAAAPRSTVWEHIVAVDRWPEWNPACAAAEVDDDATTVGATLRLQLRHPRGRLFWTSPRVVEVIDLSRYAFTTRALGMRAPTQIALTDHEDETLVQLTSHSYGPLAFTYRLMFPEKVQGQLWSGALTGLARHLRGTQESDERASD